MLIDCFPQWEDSAIVRELRKYFHSVWYIITVVALMVCSNLFSLELPVYYLYLAASIAAALVCKDALPFVPLICCSYMSVSAANNYAANQDSVFFDSSFIVQFIFILAVAVVFMLARLVSALLTRPRKRAPRLAFGFLVLGVGYILGGLFSGYYAFDTAFLGFVEIVSLCGLYFYFYYTVNWEAQNASFVLVVFVAIGFGMIFEIAGMYFLPGAFQNGVVDRHFMYTGWGTYNNVGCVMSMCVAAPFYFAVKRKNGWVFTSVGILFFLATILSQSRAAMLCGGIVFATCFVIVIAKTRGRERRHHLIVLAAVAAAAIVCVCVFRKELADLFDSVLKQGSSDNSRFKIYSECIKQFLNAPFFGVGFYKTYGHREWISNLPEPFLPPRAHNTIIQLLASGGIFALFCYAVHRAETLVLLFRRPTMLKTTIALCIAALLLTSLLDCHFFNFGPGILYGILLVFAEGSDLRRAADEAASHGRKGG